MSMELSQKQVQKQIMSQRMIQSVNILQMTSLELSDYVQDLSLENPAMDIADKPGESIDQYFTEYSFKEQDNYLYMRQNNDDDFDPRDTWNIKGDEGETLKDYLLSQLGQEYMGGESREIIDFILDSLDQNGYLTLPPGEIADIFHVDEPTVKGLIDHLKTLEPAGVCANGLEECLKLQLERRGLLSPVMESIIDDCLELVAGNRIPALARRFHLPAAEISACAQLIKSLNPRPGNAFFNREEMKYIIPDVSIVKFSDHYDIILNETAYPDVEVNTYYSDMLKTADNQEVREYLETKIRQVEWVQQCIKQRKQTMMNLTAFVLKEQIDFFEKGPDAIKPLGMSEAARALNVHESTISRAAGKKYLQCIWGVYPINFFFKRTAAIKNKQTVATGNDTGVTSGEIKRQIKEIISGEPKGKPYSDRVISELLLERGLAISRRTVAKYREEEGIPDTRGRRY